jgi:hypothetical protein
MQRRRYLVRRVTGREETVPLEDAPAPFRSTAIGPMITWEYCDCPWWHHLPLVSRRVHDDLP